MKILGINISHHGSSCLLEDNEIKFYLEDERTSRIKDYSVSVNFVAWGNSNLPIHFLAEVLKYTNYVDYIIFSSFGREEEDFLSSDDVIIEQYLERLKEGGVTWNEVIFQKENHHVYHAANAFYASGFDNAVSLIMDGGGSLYQKEDVIEDVTGGYEYFRELESIYYCNYNRGIVKDWQHFGFDLGYPESVSNMNSDEDFIHEHNDDDETDVLSSTWSCGPLFNIFSHRLGFKDGGDSGKVMGMASYCKNAKGISGWWDEIDWFTDDDEERRTTPELIHNIIRKNPFPFERTSFTTDDFFLKCRVAKKLQDETFKHTLHLIDKAVEESGCNNIILSGGYAANCMNNYRYLEQLPKHVKLYVDPIPNDGGTCLGAARWLHYKLTNSQVKNPLTTLYLS